MRESYCGCTLSMKHSLQRTQIIPVLSHDTWAGVWKVSLAWALERRMAFLHCRWLEHLLLVVGLCYGRDLEINTWLRWWCSACAYQRKNSGAQCWLWQHTGFLTFFCGEEYMCHQSSSVSWHRGRKCSMRYFGYLWVNVPEPLYWVWAKVLLTLCPIFDSSPWEM